MGVGWIYKIDRQYRRVGVPAVLVFNIGCFLTVLVPSIVGKYDSRIQIVPFHQLEIFNCHVLLAECW